MIDAADARTKYFPCSFELFEQTKALLDKIEHVRVVAAPFENTMPITSPVQRAAAKLGMLFMRREPIFATTPRFVETATADSEAKHMPTERHQSYPSFDPRFVK